MSVSALLGVSTANSGGSIYMFCLIAAFVCTLLSVIFILPEYNRNKLPKFFVFLHDVFNFNGLVLEKILKTLYIFTTLFSILTNFFGLFYVQTGEQFFYQLLALILYPIAIRVIYEIFMLAVLLVDNVMSINRKLRNKNDNEKEDNSPFNVNFKQYRAPQSNQVPPAAPTYQNAPQQIYCPKCGSLVDQGSRFCARCGNDVTK